VDNLVAESADEGCDERNDNDTCPSRHIAIDRVNELCADDGVCGGPAYTRENVEECNQFDTIPTIPRDMSATTARARNSECDNIPKSREHHLTQTKSRTESREKADREDTEQVEEQNDEDTIHESNVEQLRAQHADCERRDDHVRRQPHCRDIQHRGIRPFIFRHALNTTLFDVALCGEAVGLRIESVA